MNSVSELNKKMKDDVKVVLAEYRLALKKNDADREIQPKVIKDEQKKLLYWYHFYHLAFWNLYGAQNS